MVFSERNCDMKRQKSLLSLLLALLMVCNMIVPVSAEGANEPILTVTASKTELDVSEGTADVIYTVSLNPNGNNICAFQFELAAPEGMKLNKILLVKMREKAQMAIGLMIACFITASITRRGHLPPLSIHRQQVTLAHLADLRIAA